MRTLHADKVLNLVCGGTVRSLSMKLFSNHILDGVCVKATWLIALCFVISAGVPQLSYAQLIDPSMATGTTNSTYRKKAAARIPYKQMSPTAARRVADVVNHSSLYRQLPITTINSDPDMYLFLLRYPETIIGTWQLMGISEMSAKRTAPFRLEASDGAGTETQAELVYGQPNLNIYYAEGEYEGPMLFRKVTGSCVIMVESSYHRGPDGQTQVTSRMNFFLKIDNLAASVIAKTIHPLVGTTADHNFVETMKFAEKLSETSGRNGPGVQRMANRIECLSPEVRKSFQEMAGVVWQRSQGQQVKQASSAAIQTGYSEPSRGKSKTPYQTSEQRPGRRFYGQVQQPRATYRNRAYQLGDKPVANPPLNYPGPVMKRTGNR